jgi:hypothetical protein
MIGHDQFYTPPLANSGAMDVSAARPGEPGAAGVSGLEGISLEEGPIVHGLWECIEEPEEDSDGWTTPGWHARNTVTGETRTIYHSRFSFHMTEARFRFLVDHGFPRPPGKGPWTDAQIDAAMEDGA